MPGANLPFVEIRPGRTTTGVVIQLGAQVANLNFEITNDNGLPREASFIFTRPDLGKIGTSEVGVQGKNSLMVPPVPFRLTAEAPGFLFWHYGDHEWQTDKGVIKLKSGENLTLSIRLVPVGTH